MDCIIWRVIFIVWLRLCLSIVRIWHLISRRRMKRRSIIDITNYNSENRRFHCWIVIQGILGLACLRRRPQAGEKNFFGVVLGKYKECILYFSYKHFGNFEKCSEIFTKICVFIFIKIGVSKIKYVFSQISEINIPRKRPFRSRERIVRMFPFSAWSRCQIRIKFKEYTSSFNNNNFNVSILDVYSSQSKITQ